MLAYSARWTRLRRELEADPSHPGYLVATPGVGDCLLPEATPEQ